jgi:hypothetical protein
VNYLGSISLNIIENYAWLKATIERQKIDYTSLIRSMEKLEKDNSRSYQNIIKLLGLTETAYIDKRKTAEAIEKARKIILKIRRERKHLIKTHISKS